MPACLDPAGAYRERVRVITQVQGNDRGPAGRGQADDANAVFRPAKRIGPLLGAWVEECDDRPRLGVRRMGLVAFVTIADGQLSQRFASSLEPPQASGMM